MKVEWEKGKADLETEMEPSSILQTELILQDLSIQGGGRGAGSESLYLYMWPLRMRCLNLKFGSLRYLHVSDL